ncbi:uncharacterized protein PpBr36_09675 [Pyricularia pennisetigena]|uniref:uncharacterized protein n=1 Tax=Pyricularia pennisetigena TaxID=1578925 RepID=UPI00115379CC|nr:uncharacterized protein PpBr36_09675 [Pyricularia pennisetigena]TLS22190.1 hypothetical protein PpBr36_09675 [Pyricularia pennisetigena]
MKKRTGRRQQKRVTTSLMFPLLHSQIIDAVGKDICPAWENNAQQDGQCTNDYDTNVSGRFRCSNRACFKVWGSGLVAIRIMAFDGNRYNAIVYNQHCKKCNSLGIMKLDEARYVERVFGRKHHPIKRKVVPRIWTNFAKDVFKAIVGRETAMISSLDSKIWLSADLGGKSDKPSPIMPRWIEVAIRALCRSRSLVSSLVSEVAGHRALRIYNFDSSAQQITAHPRQNASLSNPPN